MSKVTIELDVIRKWQSRLENIDGALSISEEMYDFIQSVETEQNAKMQKAVEKKLKSVTMREVMIGDEYRISHDANFKDKYNALKGAVVKVTSKKRTNVGVTVVSDVPHFRGSSFLININALEIL